FAARRRTCGETPYRSVGALPCRAWLVRHGVDDVVHADADAEGGVLGRIGGRVGPFPGISHIRLIGDGDHEAAAVVVDAAPLVGTRIAFEGYTTVHRSLARYLVT